MRSLFGPRTVVEAAFIVAVPVIALEVGLHIGGIVLTGTVAYVLVVLVELAYWYVGRRGSLPEAAGPSVSHESPTQDVPVPPAPPEPEPVSEPEPVPVPPPAAAVIPIGGRRQWNILDLERIAREHAGGDPLVEQERTYLLLYLRDFAGPDGLLPVDFDDLVRQSFGGLVSNL